MSAILLRKRLPSTALRSLSRLASSEATPKHVPAPVKEAVPPATTPVVGQAPNRAVKWSTNQQSRPQASSLPRFEQTDMSLQPQPLSAMEMIAKEPVRLVHGRKAVCDGGAGIEIFSERRLLFADRTNLFLFPLGLTFGLLVPQIRRGTPGTSQDFHQPGKANHSTSFRQCEMLRCSV